MTFVARDSIFFTYFFGLAGWSTRCAELFPYSTYFKGEKSSATVGVASTNRSKHSDNGGTVSDGLEEKDRSHSVNGGLRDLVLD